jgi:hypothetical protein
MQPRQQPAWGKGIPVYLDKYYFSFGFTSYKFAKKRKEKDA